MSEQVKPALTPEEWEQKYHYAADIDPANGNLRINHLDGEGWVIVDGSASGKVERHAIAALALYGQNFGFTREDVNILKNAALLLAERLEVAELYYNLALRIELLLPPEKP